MGLPSWLATTRRWNEADTTLQLAAGQAFAKQLAQQATEFAVIRIMTIGAEMVVVNMKINPPSPQLAEV